MKSLISRILRALFGRRRAGRNLAREQLDAELNRANKRLDDSSVQLDDIIAEFREKEENNHDQ